MKMNFLHKMVLFCAVLISIRIFKTGHFSFLFLFWNLFLAWLPLLIIRQIKSGQWRYTRMALLGAAILFLPNAPYILTDLFHLTKHLAAPMWFDLILILSFAMLGLIYFIMSFDLILAEIKFLWPVAVSRHAKPVLLLATGYGIYLGRYLRFNSWDIVSKPIFLASEMYHSVFDYEQFKETISITLTFTVFLYIIYEIYLSFRNQLNNDSVR